MRRGGCLIVVSGLSKCRNCVIRHRGNSHDSFGNSIRVHSSSAGRTDGVGGEESQGGGERGRRVGLYLRAPVSPQLREITPAA